MCDQRFKFEEARTKTVVSIENDSISDRRTDRQTDKQKLKWFYICPIPWIVLDKQKVSISPALPYRRWWRHDDDDEIAYFTVGWKTRELVLSTAPKTRDNTDKDSKTENGPISRGSQSDVSMVRDLWGEDLPKR